MNKKALDTFGSSTQDISDAYIVWVLTERAQYSYEDLQPEFEKLERISEFTNDPYFLALYSGALFNVGHKEEALKISDRLAKL